MRKRTLFGLFMISLVGLAIIMAGCTQPPKKEPAAGAQLYTAYNIWKHDSKRHMYCINFKSAPTFIPAGTAVYGAQVKRSNQGSGNETQRIEFKIMNTGEKISIGMRSRWHPGKTLNNYFDMMFTTDNFEQLTEGLSEAEIAAIKEGTVVPGMSKRAVLIAYGYPPEHRTRSLDSDAWTYWMTTVAQKVVRFDADGRVLP
jgi:hypothetical protein